VKERTRQRKTVLDRPVVSSAQGRVTGAVEGTLLPILWGTGVALALAHWFAFQFAAPVSAGNGLPTTCRHVELFRSVKKNVTTATAALPSCPLRGSSPGSRRASAADRQPNATRTEQHSTSPISSPITGDRCGSTTGTAQGDHLKVTGWMVHAWVVPSWESPQGVFSHDNPNLRCADGT
jgi:hypothetical protein